MTDDAEYVEELRVVRRKKDTHRSKSSKSDNFESDLLRNDSTKTVAGPTESRAVDEEELRQKYQGDPIFLTQEASPTPAARRELSPEAQAIIEAVVGNLLDRAERGLRERAYPYLKDVAYPAAKRRASNVLTRGRNKLAARSQPPSRALETQPVEVEQMDDEQLPTSIDVVVAEPSIPMRRSDLLFAQLQLKLAEDYAAQRRWLITHAEVTTEDLTPELEKSIVRVLEGRGDELDDEEREAVAVFLRETRGHEDIRRELPTEPGIDE